MNSLKRIIKFQNFNLVKSVGGFWFVLLVLNILGIASISYFNTSTKIGPFLENGGYTSFAGSSLMISIFYFIIYGVLMYYEDLAMALSCGITRKEFYKGAIISNLLVVFLFSVIQTSFLFIEKIVAEKIGYSLLVNFGIFNTETDGVFTVLLILFALFLTFASAANLMGILQFRWGYKFWIGFGLAILVFVNTGPIQAVDVTEIPSWLAFLGDRNSMLFFGLIFTIVFFVLGYQFIKGTRLTN